MTRHLATMRQALEDRHLLGTVLAGDSWLPWRALLTAALGEALTPPERRIFAALTGRPCEPLERVDELWTIVGRRGGKTRAAATLAVFIAALLDHRDRLAAGERAAVLFMAASQRQAAVAFSYARGALESQPLLRQLVESVTASGIRLRNGIDLEIRPASARTSRGITALAVIVDEAAFLRLDDAADADKLILDAARPSLATTGGLLCVISSPYAKRGEVYGTWRRHYGPTGDPRILVAQGASRDFNPSLPQAIVDRALERDPAAARSEWLGLFRDDVTNFLTTEAVEAATRSSPLVLPPQDRLHYVAFVDPAGGGADEFTAAVGHREGERLIVDVVLARRGNPATITGEICALLKQYRIGSVRSDRYSAEWSRTEFRRHGIEVRDAPGARSELYLSLSAALSAGRVELPPDPVLARQLVGLERRTSRAGRDTIDHAPGAHDDRANSVAGAVASMLSERDDEAPTIAASEPILVPLGGPPGAPHLWN